MAISKEKRDMISEVIKDILISRAASFPKFDYQNRNAPFHDLILKAFEKQLKQINVPTAYLVAISSWLHGLSTSLGNGFEALAHILSGGYKRKYSSGFTLRVKEAQASNIETIIRELKSNIKYKPDLVRENNLIFKINIIDREVDALGFTVDNFREETAFIEGIELKSVRPNAGEGRGEKQKILYAKAALKLLHPSKDIKYYVGFPFDPTSDSPTGYNKERFFNYLIEFKKYFSYDEVLLASELWDHLSGEENTMDQIFEIITQTIKTVVK